MPVLIIQITRVVTMADATKRPPPRKQQTARTPQLSQGPMRPQAAVPAAVPEMATCPLTQKYRTRKEANRMMMPPRPLVHLRLQCPGVSLR
jgi:hypothetical protein